MKYVRLMAAFAALMIALPQIASASVLAKISLGSQSMTVYVDGVLRYVWPVSTARAGYRTPMGSYHAQRLEVMWHSTKYDNAPMPHAVFFNGGYAIHGTNDIWKLGRPASHGCVRLSPGNAAVFFSLVSAEGMGASQIIVSH